MVQVLRNGKPIGVYPMKIFHDGQQTTLDPLGAPIELRRGDSLHIYRPTGVGP